MAVNQENVSKILSVLSHQLRRDILLMLHERGESSFTDLMNALNVDTGKMSFHMRNLGPFLEQTDTGKYRLNDIGESAVEVIKDVESWSDFAGIGDRRTTELPIASFKWRTFAFLVDLAIMGSLTTLFMLWFIWTLATINWLIPIVNLVFIALGALWVYSTILEGFNGQSLGKRLFSLKVVRVDGKKITYDCAAVRNFGKILLPFDLIIGLNIRDPRFIRYFDKFAGTTVIDLHKNMARATTENSKQSTSERIKEAWSSLKEPFRKP